MEEKYTSERRNDNIDIVALWRAACRKWSPFVGSTEVCVALVVCYLKIAKPVYEVCAEILVNLDENKCGCGFSSSLGDSSGAAVSLSGMMGVGLVVVGLQVI